MRPDPGCPVVNGRPSPARRAPCPVRGRRATLGIAPLLALVLALGHPGAPARRAGAQSACSRSVVTAPVAGDVVSGDTRVLGSAQIERFNFYKLEWATAADPETWIATSTIISAPVRHAVLDRWDTSGLAAGAYRLKLTVVDVDAQERCRFIVEPLVVAEARAGSEPGTPAAALPTSLPTSPPERAAPSPTAPATSPPTAAATASPAPSTPTAADATATRAKIGPTSDAPTDVPTDVPTDEPTEVPTQVPTDVPTEVPIDVATEAAATEPDTALEDETANGGGGTPGAMAAAGDAEGKRTSGEPAGGEAEAVEPTSETDAAAALATLARKGFVVGFGATAVVLLLAVALWARSARR